MTEPSLGHLFDSNFSLVQQIANRSAEKTGNYGDCMRQEYSVYIGRLEGLIMKMVRGNEDMTAMAIDEMQKIKDGMQDALQVKA